MRDKMEVIKIKYHKPKHIFEVALYTRKNNELVELEGKGYKRQKCKLPGENVSFPPATENWDTVYGCGFIRNGKTYVFSMDQFLISKGGTITITLPKEIP